MSDCNFPDLPQPARPVRWIVVIPAVLAAAVGCRYQNYGATGTLSAAPFTDLECFEPDNPEGFSFEVPACDCTSGMRLRYFARPRPAPSDIHLEFETNFHDEDPSDDVKMVSHAANHVEHLFIGGRELPPYDRSSAIDRAQWDIAQESFSSMMRNYEPVLRRAFQTCAEDRLARRQQELLGHSLR
jgi:hypothetical protein